MHDNTHAGKKPFLSTEPTLEKQKNKKTQTWFTSKLILKAFKLSQKARTVHSHKFKAGNCICLHSMFLTPTWALIRDRWHCNCHYYHLIVLTEYPGYGKTTVVWTKGSMLGSNSTITIFMTGHWQTPSLLTSLVRMQLLEWGITMHLCTSMKVCVGKWLHTQSSHPTLGEPWGF